MKLGIEKIKEIACGAEKIEITDNGIYFSRFTDSELVASTSPNVRSSAGIYMEFLTDASAIDICVFVKKILGIRTYFCFEIFVDDKRYDTIKNFEEKNMVGNYADVSTNPLGDFSKKIELSSGEKKVRIVFPHSVATYIKNLELVGATYVTPVKRDKIILMYGDSITQGFDAVYPTNTYAMQLSDRLGAEIFNKGIGGEFFCPKLVIAENDIKPDYVFVSYGTNEWGFSDKETLDKSSKLFFESVSRKYNYLTVYVLTPVWRKDFMSEKPFGSIFDVERIIMKNAKDYSNLKVISGWDFIPHDEKYFGDLRLHPNDDGFCIMFENIVQKM